MHLKSYIIIYKRWHNFGHLQREKAASSLVVHISAVDRNSFIYINFFRYNVKSVLRVG